MEYRIQIPENYDLAGYEVYWDSERDDWAFPLYGPDGQLLDHFHSPASAVAFIRMIMHEQNTDPITI